MSDLRQVINERNIKRSGYDSGAFEPDNFETARRTVNRQGRIEVRVGILSRERSRSPVNSRNIDIIRKSFNKHFVFSFKKSFRNNKNKRKMLQEQKKNLLCGGCEFENIVKVWLSFYFDRIHTATQFL